MTFTFVTTVQRQKSENLKIKERTLETGDKNSNWSFRNNWSVSKDQNATSNLKPERKLNTEVLPSNCLYNFLSLCLIKNFLQKKFNTYLHQMISGKNAETPRKVYQRATLV